MGSACDILQLPVWIGPHSSSSAACSRRAQDKKRKERKASTGCWDPDLKMEILSKGKFSHLNANNFDNIFCLD